MTPKHTRPPILANRLLQWFCSDKVLETLQGDLHELYWKRCQSGSIAAAKFYFIMEVLDVCRPFAWKKMSNNSIYITMFRNYFKVAWRNLLKYKMYSFIKIGGFAIGISAFILISLFVREELSYDKYYKDVDRLYRVVNVFDSPSETEKWVAFPAQIGEVLHTSFPEVEMAARLIPYNGWFDAGNNQFRRIDRDQSVYEEGFAYADPELLEVLEIPMVYGSRENALSEVNAIVLSRKKAEKYFPGENPVGKTILLNDETEEPFVVGGVMEDFPTNSHLQFEFFITLYEREFWPGEQTNWCCWNYNAYVKLLPNSDPLALEEKLLLIRDQFIVKYMEERGNQGAEDTKKYHAFDLQPVKDIYLHSTDLHNPTTGGSMAIVWLFSAIAIFVLILACINFVNLSTAKSANRAKEVGMRKVVGSFKSHLIQQFLTESFLVCFISVLLGLGLTMLLLPFFNDMALKQLVIPWSEWWFVPTVVAFVLVITLLAGLYPSFYLSAFRPIDVLKGSLSRGSKNSVLRNIMVIFQFATSIVLIVGALLVQDQLQYIMNKELGFDKEHVLMIQGANTLGEQRRAFKEELKNLAEVKSVAASSYFPVEGTRRDQNQFWLDGRSELDKPVGAQRWQVDVDYIETMGIKLVEGRNFTEMASDSSAIIINQRMAKQLNLENPIGAKIMNWETWTVIGVMEDFHFETMKSEIRPVGLVRREFGDIVAVKLQSNNISGLLSTIDQKWSEFMPNQPIRYTFLDESFARMYDDISRTGKVFTSFAVLAIIVACLGLFGLSAFMVEQRSKEISIRKVLGASFQVIFQLLTLNFVRMILIALVIAVPLAIYLMTDWLADFEYAVPIGWKVFAWAGLLVTVIAMVTVSFESIKAAVLNPVKGLRSE